MSRGAGDEARTVPLDAEGRRAVIGVDGLGGEVDEGLLRIDGIDGLLARAVV